MLADFALLTGLRALIDRFGGRQNIPEEEITAFIGAQATGSTARADIEKLFETLEEAPEIIETLAEEAAVRSILSDLSPNLQYEDESQNGFSAYGYLDSIVSSGGDSARITRLFDPDRQDYFGIKYYDKFTGKGRYFRFSLLPAIENKISPLIPGQTVPGVQPGIMINTAMRHRNILIPGSTPVYQAIGLESVEIRLCGLLSGDETVINDTPGPITFTDNELGNATSGYDLAQFFREEVVIPGVPVDVEIYASAGQVAPLQREGANPNGSIKINGSLLIKSFRSMSARASREYYCIDAFLINYKLEKRADPKGTQSAADLEICQLSAQQWREKMSAIDTSPESAREGNQNSPAPAEGQPATPTVVQLPEPVSNACLTLLASNGFDISDLNKAPEPPPVPSTVPAAMVGEGERDNNATSKVGANAQTAGQAAQQGLEKFSNVVGAQEPLRAPQVLIQRNTQVAP